jgi:hypothetical protein
MKFSKVSLGIAAAALAAAPAIAQVAMTPAIAPLSGDESEVQGSTLIVGVIAAAAIIGGIIVASDNNDPDLPISG